MIDVIKRVKYLVCQRYFDNLALGEYLFDLPRELTPLPQSPEIVAVPEAASKQVFAEPLRLLLLQFHLSDFHGVYIGIFEQVWIHDPNRMRTCSNIPMYTPWKSDR